MSILFTFILYLEIHYTNTKGSTVLHIAVRNRSPAFDIIRALIGAGSSPTALNRANQSVLHTYLHASIRRQLLQSNVAYTDSYALIDLFHRDLEDMTILHYLCHSHAITPVELAPLIQRQHVSALAVRDCLGRTPIDMAAYRGNANLLRHFFGLEGMQSMLHCSSSDGISCLHMAVRSRRVDTIRAIVELGGDVTASDIHGRSVLHYAAMHRNRDAINTIVEIGGEQLWAQADNLGKTAGTDRSHTSVSRRSNRIGVSTRRLNRKPTT